ncbi:hypothetical protein DYQ86_10310 [Acidobacteria bacterium AB60]|nr:hypothetical protein DYQ86_10310 [Acidobacteria bacterium AB60]
MHVRAIARILLCFAVVLFSCLILSGCGGSKAQNTPIQPATVVIPSISLTVSPATVLPGESATVSWSSKQAASCNAEGAWSGSQSLSGSMNVMLPTSATETFVLYCTSSSGQAARASATLSLSPAEAACSATHPAASAAPRAGKHRLRGGAHS